MLQWLLGTQTHPIAVGALSGTVIASDTGTGNGDLVQDSLESIAVGALSGAVLAFDTGTGNGDLVQGSTSKRAVFLWKAAFRKRPQC